MTKAELLESIEAGLRIEARNGLLRLRFTDVDAFVTAAHSAVQVRLVDMQAAPANPFVRGTFQWAGTEYAAGRTVGRADASARLFVPLNTPNDWSQRAFRGEDFYATDWRVR
jgi:hypothetical protein